MLKKFYILYDTVFFIILDDGHKAIFKTQNLDLLDIVKTFNEISGAKVT